ncbi:MAG: hypothetical protein WA862_07000 [Solirubrobacterales bacterium]
MDVLEVLLMIGIAAASVPFGAGIAALVAVAVFTTPPGDAPVAYAAGAGVIVVLGLATLAIGLYVQRRNAALPVATEGNGLARE